MPGSDAHGAYETREYNGESFSDFDQMDDFDVVHNHPVRGPWVGAFFVERLLRRNPRLVQTYHGSFPYYIRPYARFLRAFPHRPRPQLIVQNRRTLEYGARHRVPNLHLIPNALPQPAFNPDRDDYLLYLGRVTPKKGVDVAVQVAQRTGSRLLIAGPPDGDYLETTIRPLLSDQIQYLGVVSNEERARLFARARALLFPSRFGEGVPLAVLESILSGTPVVSSNAYWAAPDLVKDGVTGFLCRDADDMAAAVARLDSIDRRSCYEWARGYSSIEAVTEAHLRVYEEARVAR